MAMAASVTEQSPFQSLDVSLIVSLLPQDLHDPMESIESQLHYQLMRFEYSALQSCYAPFKLAAALSDLLECASAMARAC